jgi:hypothetical protein
VTTGEGAITRTIQAADGSVVIQTWEMSAADAELWGKLMTRRYGPPDHEYLADQQAAVRIGQTALSAVEEHAVSLHSESREG